MFVDSEVTGVILFWLKTVESLGRARKGKKETCL